jgi:hypothetical protein
VPRGKSTSDPTHHAAVTIAAEQAIVSTPASTMLPATPQRTAVALLTEPTPTIAPVIVGIADTGMPRPVARNSAIGPAVSAQKRPTGKALRAGWLRTRDRVQCPPR